MGQYLEYLNYSLQDLLHFTPRSYYRLFELYNDEIRPVQALAVFLGAAIAVLAFRTEAWRGRAIASILAASFLWVAGMFLYRHLATIHLGAAAFALAFALQALLLLWAGMRGGFEIEAPTHPAGRAALGIFLFALIVHPLLAPMIGRPVTQAELFALMPDPTVLGALGVVLLAAGRVRWELLALPLVWCAVSGATLWIMKSPDALVLPVLGSLALALALWKTLARRAA